MHISKSGCWCCELNIAAAAAMRQLSVEAVLAISSSDVANSLCLFHTTPPNAAAVELSLHRDAEKKEPIFFCVHLFYCSTETMNFFHIAYIKKSIGYNCVYLILARVKNSL